MSLQTWQEEFYKKHPSKRMTTKQAIEHSIQKWIGLRKTNLKAHQIYREDAKLVDDNSESWFFVDTTTCALCQKFFYLRDWVNENDEVNCPKCPLRGVLGNECDYNYKSPYRIWRTSGNPEPMIRALKTALEAYG